ncbi:MAG: WhiB family transcriptional regulator [Streptomyces sp.]|nr:WhiB family transcriptional regulator [Streptomyces sp.]
MSGYSGQTPETERAADWRDKASCRGEDSEVFFASSQTAAGQADIRHAKVICFGCPVMQACGQWAFETRQPFGVWGGVSESERRSILRRRGIRLVDDPDTAEARAAS